MAQVTGTVTGQHDKFNKVNIQVNGTWYSTKAEWFKGTVPEKGDVVEFDDGGGKFIKNLKIKGKDASGGAPAASGGKPARGTARAYRANGEEGGFPIHPLAYERALDRRVAIQVAAQVLGSGHSPDEYIEVARTFEDYTTGTADAEAARELVGAELSKNSVSGGWDS